MASVAEIVAGGVGKSTSVVGTSIIRIEYTPIDSVVEVDSVAESSVEVMEGVFVGVSVAEVDSVVKASVSSGSSRVGVECQSWVLKYQESLAPWRNFQQKR